MMRSHDAPQYFSWRQVSATLQQIGGTPEEVIFFQREDLDAWVVLAVAFVVLFTLDMLFLSEWKKRMTIQSALQITIMWVLCAAAFGVYVFYRFGASAAWKWSSAYMLEWLLSFDNLFVFHSIFEMYKTPESQRYKPLLLGILGAVVLRLGFIFVGEYMMHAMWYAHVIFGMLLVFTGVRVAFDDDADDISQNSVVQFVTRYLPVSKDYDPNGSFFIQVPKETATNKTGNPNEDSDGYGSVARRGPVTVWRGTLLLLVLVSIEVADLVFAVDSVTAVVAQVNTLYLAYSAVIFAMLGLRAGYFVIDTLASTFELFKYGIATILVFIGMKLIFQKVIQIPAHICCVVMLGTLSLSVLLSTLFTVGTPKDKGTPRKTSREPEEAPEEA